MMLGAVYEVAKATYELTTVVTDIILNYEYVNRGWVEEYILSIVFLVVNGFVMGFVGLGIESLHRNRYSTHNSVNKLLGFCIGLLQMRVFVETLYTVVASLQTGQDKPQATAPDRAFNVPDANCTQVVDGHNAAVDREDNSQQVETLRRGLLYAVFIQVIVRDVPLFVLQANATIHYRKWKFIDLFTVISTFLTLTHGAAVYVAKEDKIGMQVLAFVFLVGQFVFRLGAILLMAMTTGVAIVIYGLVITLFSILWTAKLRLAHPSDRFLDQLPRAIVFFPLFTLFVVDGSKITARYGSTLTALDNKNLLQLHLWRCCENLVGIVLAVCLPRYTDFGHSSDGTIIAIGAICAAVYVVTSLIFYYGLQYCKKPDAQDDQSPPLDAAAIYNPM
ncbi:hypothetical protein PHYBOEH_005481 [Phytophthora boehmeriae]|uniref:Uncharacterized protein n=1 Tax=Phytophthora boehmeriae TaxID=109152 RepID=A0A8T1WLE3_9STRA|nr:hypothetical protein PHYBOEH_005481 [Phytophthora boehmeriae]